MFQNIFKKPKRAAVLVEFAIALPMLISLVYFAYDVPRLKRLEAQLKADISYIEQMLNTIRNRETINKKVTKTDIVNMISAIGITHNMTALMSLPYRINVAMTLIKGVGFDKFSVCWHGYGVFEFDKCIEFKNGRACTKFPFETNSTYDTSEIDSSIHIMMDEYKIIVEVGLNNYIEEKKEQSQTIKPKFGFAFIEPKNAKNLYDMKLRQYSVITVNKFNFSDSFPE